MIWLNIVFGGVAVLVGAGLIVFRRGFSKLVYEGLKRIYGAGLTETTADPKRSAISAIFVGIGIMILGTVSIFRSFVG